MAKKDEKDGVLEQIQAASAAGPAGGAAAARRPIGVPAGYAASTVREVPNPDQFGPGVPLRVPTQIQPRYFDGDEFQPNGLATERIVALQSSLVRSGLIGKKDKFRVGVWDDVSASAYRKALEYANQSGLDAQQAVATLGSVQLPDQEPQRAPLVKRLPNAADLRSTFQTVAQNVIGRGVDPTLIDGMVNTYTQAVGGQQQQQYNLGETGGTVTEVPSADVFAEQRIRAARPEEAGAHDIANRYGRFLKMLGPGGGML